MDRQALILAVREAALSGEASRKGLRQVVRVLEWAEAYVGKGIADGMYDGCAVPAPRALEHISEARAILDGCYEPSPTEQFGPETGQAAVEVEDEGEGFGAEEAGPGEADAGIRARRWRHG